MCGHDFKYRSITIYPSVPSKFKLQLKIWCCPKPCFSFHFSICATLSNIQLEKVSRKLMHSQNFPSMNSHLEVTPSSYRYFSRSRSTSGSLSREPEIFSRPLFLFPCHGNAAAVFIPLMLLFVTSRCSVSHSCKTHCYSQGEIASAIASQLAPPSF